MTADNLDEVDSSVGEEEVCVEFNDNGSVSLSRRNSRKTSSASSNKIKKSKPNKRLIYKNGKALIWKSAVPRRVYQYSVDIASTFVHSNWKWTLLTLILAHLSTWTIFALSWMAIAKANGDLEFSNSTNPCFLGIQGFSGYFLFSLETQTSIGFGTRSITHFCPEAVFVICLQVLVGIGICGTAVGVVFAKMSGPKRLNSKQMFSKNAVIYQRDGQFCLIFRTQDISKKYQCQTAIKAYLNNKRGDEAFLTTIKLEPPPSLIWPGEVVHKITESSPFWDLSAKDLIMKNFEIVVVMEGICTSTNQMSRAITSYLSKEILWGTRFKSCVSYSKEKNCYVVSQNRFNATKEIPTPLCSAERMFEVYENIMIENEIRNSENSPVSEAEQQPSPENSPPGTMSPDSGIVVSPVTVHVDKNYRDEISSYSSEENLSDEENCYEFMEKEKNTVADMDYLLNSLQKHVYHDAKRRNTLISLNQATLMETSF